MSAYLCRQTFFLLIKIQGIEMAKKSVKFRYIGKNKNMNGVYGYDFSNHAVVEVENEFAIGKLSGNKSHFEIVEDDEDDRIDDPDKIAQLNSNVTDVTLVKPGLIEETPEENVAYGVFRLKGDGSIYAKPDKVFTTVEEDAQTYIDSFDDGKERVIRTKKIEAHK
jgi:stalled ribosome rescue protein Dom34